MEDTEATPDTETGRKSAVDAVVMRKRGVVTYDSTQGEDAMSFHCLDCGDRQRMALPVSIPVWCAAGKAFKELHRSCQSAA